MASVVIRSNQGYIQAAEDFQQDVLGVAALIMCENLMRVIHELPLH